MHITRSMYGWFHRGEIWITIALPRRIWLAFEFSVHHIWSIVVQLQIIILQWRQDTPLLKGMISVNKLQVFPPKTGLQVWILKSHLICFFVYTYKCLLLLANKVCFTSHQSFYQEDGSCSTLSNHKQWINKIGICIK